MRYLTRAALTAGVSGIAFFFPASAGTVFSDSNAFAAATKGITTKTLDQPLVGLTVIVPNTAITFANGIVSKATSNQQFNQVIDGAFKATTRAGRTDVFDSTIPLDIVSDITAFDGFFTTASDTFVSGEFDGAANSLLLGDIRRDDGVIGLTRTTGFSTGTFSTDMAGFSNTAGFSKAAGLLPSGNPSASFQAKKFELDNLSTGQSLSAEVATPVPLPASAILLLGALGGLGAMRKWRRAAA